jgi:translation initiation factor 6 (eIF-6)
LGGTAAEVEGEGGLVGAKVVDVEDEFLREVFGVTPDNPADSRVDETIFMSA